MAQDSVLHWAAHAQLERRHGELDDARKVYQTVLLSSKPPATDLGLPILWYNCARKSGGHQNHITSSGYRDHKFWSGILREKRQLEDAADTLTCSIIDTTEMKEREVWVKLCALLETIAGKDATLMLWQVSPSRRSDQCSTREHDDGGIGDAVPTQNYC